MQISGQSAIITGGASGLGAATARHLAGLGARVGLLDHDLAGAEALAAELGGAAAQVDVRDADAVGAAMDAVVAEIGAPRLAVNCAGIADAGRILGREGALSTELFARVIGVNLIGTFNVMSHAARHMATLEPLEGGERGVIVNTSSIAMEEGQFGQCGYAASKGGVASMSLPAARELTGLGIRVVAIAPGLFNTPMMEGLPEDVTAKIVSNIVGPKRLGNPSEFALMVAQIAENPYLNGTTIRLDGATRLPPR
ncbi:SDR family NAD(P)-dependent oxidoreductase [Pseudaestuariivita sp.]|uniref:SDR family NAD(P)-dependent oxidoreductase n=1 Tax=Pseudaestuariivita sp. TaxID=2211669 RepID=UPI004057E3BD